MVEQRKSARHKTFYGAQISVAALSGWSVDCTVKDLGQGGARIALPARAAIPDSFTLGIPRRTTEAARLVWHRDGVVGVAFAPQEPAGGVKAPSIVGTTRLERRIAAIVNRGMATVPPIERRVRVVPSLRG